MLPVVLWLAEVSGAPAGPPAATQPVGPETRPSDAIRLNFKDAPLDLVLEHLSQVAGFVVVKEAPVDGRVTVLSMRAVTPEEAVTLLDTVLKANGFTAIQNGRTLRIVARDQAKKSDIPVHFGADPDAIESTDQLITQVIPIRNIDAVKLRDDLKPLIGVEADVTANAGSNSFIITDNSANVKRIAEIISTLDKREGTASEIRVIQLKNASASAAAKLVMSIFHPEEPQQAQKGQPQAPPPPPREGKIPGNGVDQALHGGKVTAAADDRTNTVVVAGPSDTVKVVEDMLRQLDANPAQVMTIKSFHLRVAEADTVAHLIVSIFQSESGPAQIHGAGETPLHTRVSAAAEDRTNTVVVTAPSSVMTVIEGIIKDIEANPGGETGFKSFHLKYADATATATALTSVFDDGMRRRRGPGAMERMSVTPDSRTNTVIVSGSAEGLHEAERLIADLDANPTDGTEVRFFHLKVSDAGTAAKIIMGFFKPPDLQQRAQSATPRELERHLAVNAQADDRSNTLVVTAPPDAMKVVENIIKEIETDPWLSYDIRTYSLTFADAEATAKLIESIFSPAQQQQQANPQLPGKGQALHAIVIAAPDDRTNSVVVTAPADTLKVIDGVVKLLDANPVSAADMKVFQLQYADATNAAKLIESIFEPETQSNSAQGSSRRQQGPPVEQAHHSPVIAAADDRTNSLVVTAPADILKVIETLVQQLDANPASEQTFFMYRLRNGIALDMASVLNQLFGYGASGGPTGGLAGSNLLSQQSRPLGQTTGALGSSFGGRSLGAGGGAGLGSNFGGPRGTSTLASSIGGGMSSMSSRLGGAATGLSQLTGQVYVVGDPDTNALLVTTATKYEKQVRQIIAELDRSVPQVLIKVLVAEVMHDNSADFGLDYSILNTRANGLGQSFTQSFGAPSGGLVVGLIEDKINATLHALAQQNKLDVLSRPYILTSDNQEATILVGQEVPIVTSNTTTALGQTISNYQYQKVGIILDVTPHINPDGLVTLDVAPEISQLTSQTVTVGPGVNVPVIADRSAQSRVGIRDGQTIVIGGLMQDQKTLTVNKIPILGDIPFLGWAFSRTQVDKTKTELLIFLTPHVAQQPDVLNPMSQDELKGTRLTPNAVEPGALDEHLRGLDRGNIPQTRPATQPAGPSLEFEPGAEPATQRATQTLHLPPR